MRWIKIFDLTMSRMTTPRSWPMLSFLPADLAGTIVQAFVFGGAGNEALVTMSSGDIYALGFNGNGCLGIGNSCSTMEPKKVEELSQKKIVNLAFGSGPHVLAVTDSGELYSWGHWGYGQLGHTDPNKSIPVLVKSNFGKKKIEQVACGSYHSVALASGGEVYSWGSNNCGQLGIGSTNNQAVPVKVEGLLSNKSVCSISCGQSFTVALTDGGELFSWGYNGNGQLGIRNTTNQQAPCKVSVGKSTIISKVMCGMAHVLALSDTGELYSWGANSYGQIGVGTTMNASVPTILPVVEERWSDIAAHHYSHISAAITVTGQVFMWGQCHGLTLLSPRNVAVASLDHIFACFAMPQIMFRPVMLDNQFGRNTVTETVKSSFDDEDTGDLTFIVECRPIHVHKAILKIRCQYFRSMLQSHWEEHNKSEIEISEFSYVVYRAFLYYLYSDEVNIAPDDAVGLLDLAHLYCEANLKQKCEDLIKQSITIENSSSLMEAAIQYNAKGLEDFCFSFMVGHLTAVSQSSTFKDLDGETVKKFIVKAGKLGAFNR